MPDVARHCTLKLRDTWVGNSFGTFQLLFYTLYYIVAIFDLVKIHTTCISSLMKTRKGLGKTLSKSLTEVGKEKKTVRTFRPLFKALQNVKLAG